MSDNAQEILQRMRSDKDKPKDTKKGPTKPVDVQAFTTRLIITPHRRSQLVFWMIVAFATFVSILSTDIKVEKHWLLTSLPLICLGSLMCLIPATEEWEYRPWQTSARQYERHQVER